MRRKLRLMAGAFFSITIILSGAATAQVEIGNINMDWVEWGLRQMIVPLENHGEDTARVRIQVSTLYTDHYLSGLDLYEKDTIFYLAPGLKTTVNYPFEIPGSFGRATTRCFAYWYYPESCTLERCSDSAGQSFSSVFQGSADAAPYIERKHCIGPAFAPMEIALLNFEFPRLALYLLSRQKTVDNIGRLFIVSAEYTHFIRTRLAEYGLFAPGEDSLAPRILAISETEGFALKAGIKAAAERFAEWYENKGGAELERILKKAKIDERSADLPALRMEILLTLLTEPWVDPEGGFDTPHFDNMTDDIAGHNRPRWIVQGGEFFMPRLCLAVFERDGYFTLGTFTLDPRQPFEKTVMQNMLIAAEETADSIPVITATQMKDIIKRAAKKKLVEDIAGDLRTAIDKAQAEIEFIRPYQYPFLADYVYRVVLGEYFGKHPAADGRSDFIRVEYQP